MISKQHDWVVLIALFAAVTGCSSEVRVEPNADEPASNCSLLPEGHISSLDAWNHAQCLMASEPDLKLIWMRTSPTTGAKLDGLGFWRFHFASAADTSTHEVVDMYVTGVTTTSSTSGPCYEPITPFDSIAITTNVAPLLPPNFQDNLIHIDKSASCTGHWDVHGLTLARVSDSDDTNTSMQFLLDDQADVVSSCGPCASPVPESCGCKVE